MKAEPASEGGGAGLTVFTIAAIALCVSAPSDVGFRDAGELGAAAHVLGVPHPTGFACDMLLLKLFEWLPLGAIAFRQNLAVALEAAAALALLAELCERLAQRLGVTSRVDRWAGLLVASCGLASWHTFLETALTVEVYSLALLAVLLCANAAVRGRRAAGLCFAVLGLAFGLHVTAGLFVALLLLIVLLEHPARGRFVVSHLPALLAGALCLAYLPLAARRDPPLNWGDPSTFARVFDHLTAARIRSAYQADMWGGTSATAAMLAEQLVELWPLAPLALLALVRTPRRLLTFAVLGALGLDLAYALHVNPMGIADRQVGHVAGAALALLGGLGAALGCAALGARSRAARACALGASLGLCALALLRAPAALVHDGHAASELLGSGGAFADVPARSVLVCSRDDTCAVGLFARYVDDVRPDVALVPAQHLWDPKVRQRLGALPQLRAFGAREPPDGQRAEASQVVLRALLDASRPVLVESVSTLRAADPGVRVIASVHPPWLVAQGGSGPAEGAALEAALNDLERRRMHRLPEGRVVSPRAQAAWSLAYDDLAGTGLGTWAAVAAERVAVQIAPGRAVAWTNLGVAFEHVGALRPAIESTLRAIQTDPRRPTPWVNLARMQLAAGDHGGAGRTVAAAERAGVHAAALHALRARLARDSVQH